MSDWNQHLNTNYEYQVWATNWPEDGSGGVANENCTRTHANAVLLGNYHEIEEAVKCYTRNESYEPIITRLVEWSTKIEDVTGLAGYKDKDTNGGVK